MAEVGTSHWLKLYEARAHEGPFATLLKWMQRLHAEGTLEGEGGYDDSKPMTGGPS